MGYRFRMGLDLTITVSVPFIMVEMRSESRVGLHVKCLLFASVLTKIGLYRYTVMNLSSIKFYGNLYSGCRVLVCIHGRTHGRTQLTLLRVASALERIWE
jgi:hypothetical protein